MKKILLMLIFMISIGSISYMRSVNQKQLETEKNKIKRSFKSKFTNAKVTAYCEGGKVIYKGSFKKGKKDGEWITYYKCEIIKLKANYKNGKRDGESITYDKTGKIKFKSKYKDGEYINDNIASRFSY